MLNTCFKDSPFFKGNGSSKWTVVLTLKRSNTGYSRQKGENSVL